MSASVPDRVLSPTATEPVVSAHWGNAPLRVLSLFAGIGGFDLGLERTGGFETVAFCEIDPHAQRILANHWPEVPCYDDVTELTGERLRADGVATPNVIVGGFPCQDISVAGRRAGITGETRSGLWSEVARLTSEIRPAFLIVENVSNLLSGPSECPGGWFGRVLGDLAALGYDAEWHCIPASYIGLPHGRDRTWIVAHPYEEREVLRERFGGFLLHHRRDIPRQWYVPASNSNSDRFSAEWADQGLFVPVLGRKPDGFPNGMDRLARLGNAVVPQIPELIGRAILASLAEQRAAA